MFVSASRTERLLTGLRAFWPARMRINGRERVRAVVGAALGILLTGIVSHALSGRFGDGTAWLIAPIGASAVLVFAVPGSPLAQPWPVIGGNTLSALVGVACAHWIPDPALAAAAAVGLAIGTMFTLRCLHPPGGSTALLAVLGHTIDLHYAWFPVLLDAVLLVLAGIVYNSLTGRRYPHAQAAPAAPAKPSASRFSAADLDAALAHYNQVLDISRDDLEALLHEAELASFRRTLGELRCADIMTRTLVTTEFGMPLKDAWALLRERRIKALPVIDRSRRIVGIVTVADFMRHADLDTHHGLGQRLRALLQPSRRTHTGKPEVVGQIMTREVRVASAERLAIELVPLFSEGGHHHIPIIDNDQRLVGIITQSDLVKVLYRAARPD